MTSHLPVLIVLPLLLGAISVPALGLWRRRLAYPSALVSVLAFLLFSAATLVEVAENGPLRYSMAGWDPPIGIELGVDMLGAFLVNVVAVVALLVIVYARGAVRAETPSREVPFYSLFLILLVGLAGIIVTADLFNLYVFFEVSSLAAYALMAMGDKKAFVSAFRYLILGTLGASFYLIAVGYLYMLTGSLNMADVAARIAGQGDNPALQVSAVLMVVGLGLKMALFPMHLWLPDAYTYASSTATAIIAPIMTKISAYVLIRMLFFVYDAGLVMNDLHLGAVVAWLSALGVVAGSVMAIAQKDVKRMLAYSSVAQVAYIGVGIGLGNAFALIGAILHVLNHAVMKSCLFLVSGGVALRTGAERVDAYTGLGRRMPWTFAAFTLAALAMVGIPPTNGFFSKWYLVLGGIQAGAWGLVIIVLASGLLTAVYFFRLLERIYARSEPAVTSVPQELPLSMRAPLLALGVSTLILGLFNAWIIGAFLKRALPPGMSLDG